MIWLTWRQFRVQAAAVYALVAALAAALMIAGRPLIDAGTPRLGSTDVALYFGSVVAIYLLPGIIGTFWGAPLVTRELEAGTHRLVWNQSVSRSRWLLTKLAFTGLAAMAVAGLFSLAVTWWASPVDAASRPGAVGTDAHSIASRISPLLFGARGIAPVGYAAFAFVLGVSFGILLRRTVIAMAATLVVFAAVQLAMPFVARPYLLAGVQETVTVSPANVTSLSINPNGQVNELAVAGPSGSWVTSNETVDSTGAAVSPPSSLAHCLLPQAEAIPTAPRLADCFAEFADQGFRQQVTYQPASRFWALQWIETALFLALTAVLATLCVRWARRLS